METIGLTTKQLRRLGKAYTDNQMVKRSDFDEILVTGKVWSNREIILFESPPSQGRSEGPSGDRKSENGPGDCPAD